MYFCQHVLNFKNSTHRLNGPVRLSSHIEEIEEAAQPLLMFGTLSLQQRIIRKHRKSARLISFFLLGSSQPPRLSRWSLQSRNSKSADCLSCVNPVGSRGRSSYFPVRTVMPVRSLFPWLRIRYVNESSYMPCKAREP